jgi:anti-sigma regulatory factor (Ser/Thr protein kinase)
MNGSTFSEDIAACETEAESLTLRLRAWLNRVAEEPDRFAIELLCREAIANAVSHGCRSDSAKRVRVKVERRAGTFYGQIEDEGAGFTPSIQRELFDLRHAEKGMGIAIIAHYADRIAFEDGGRIVRFEKRVTGGMLK